MFSVKQKRAALCIRKHSHACRAYAHRAADVYTNVADMWVLCAVQESWTKPQWMAKWSKCRYCLGLPSHCLGSCWQGKSTGLTRCLSLCAAWRLLWWMAVQQGESLLNQADKQHGCPQSQSVSLALSGALQVVGPFKGRLKKSARHEALAAPRPCIVLVHCRRPWHLGMVKRVPSAITRPPCTLHYCLPSSFLHAVP